jgi:spore coat polysaccharide biosynthesis predicted glycosyltransferase SpsG
MKLTLHSALALMLFLTAMPTQAQEKITFTTVREYLDYAKANFGIAPEEVYYVSRTANHAPPKKVSPVMFFQDGQMAVIEDVARVLKDYGAPASMLKKVNPEAIKKTMFTDAFANSEFTNLATGKTYKPGKGEMLAIVLMGQEMGSVNEDYVKARRNLKDIKTIVVTVDENDITELVKRRKM